MNRALFTKSLRDARLLFAALAVLLFFYTWLNIWLSSTISLPAFGDYLAKALPKQWERIYGVSFSEIATTAGRAALVFVHPLIVYGVAFWAIARGSDCVSGEIGRGTMEMLLAQPVRRTAVYGTQALVTILGSAALATAVWCGIAMALATVSLPERVSATLFIPSVINLFGVMVCLGGMAALASSWGSQRWRTIGLVSAWYVVSTVLTIVGQAAEGWQWLTYISFMSACKTQSLVARPAEAWSLLMYRDGAVVGIGLGGMQLILFGLGISCYAAGAVIFSRREIPAPL